MPDGNPMDILQPSGFALRGVMLTNRSKLVRVIRGPLFPISELRLMLQTILQSKPGSVFHFGVVCSSWVSICKGTTGRTFLNPLGYPWVKCVQEGNVMVGRPVL